MKTPSLVPVPLSAPLAARLGDRLLTWFEANKRSMPWRETRDPYAIWVSEIMLQQTQVATVIPYYERFMARFPSVIHLAEAPLDDLLKHWEGLGYYSRARNLQKAAQTVAVDHGGQFPVEYDQIRALPGIGDYTAGAISAIAYNQPRPAVDGNVFRVLSRWFALDDDITRPQTRKRFEDLATRLIPTGEAWRFNQALMEFGATLCTPVNPRCALCPLASDCLAHAQSRVTDFPVKSKKAAPKDVSYAVGMVAEASGRLLITRRPQKGLLGGLWEFPTFEVPDADQAADHLALAFQDRFGLRVGALRALVTVPHAFTHRRALFHAYQAGLDANCELPAERDDLRWVLPSELDAFAFPLAHNKIRAAMTRPAQLALDL